MRHIGYTLHIGNASHLCYASHIGNASHVSYASHVGCASHIRYAFHEVYASHIGYASHTGNFTTGLQINNKLLILFIYVTIKLSSLLIL